MINHNGIVQERMELITHLTTHHQKALSLSEPLFQLLIDRWRRDVSELGAQKSARSSKSNTNHLLNYEIATISSCKVATLSRKS